VAVRVEVGRVVGREVAGMEAESVAEGRAVEAHMEAVAREAVPRGSGDLVVEVKVAH
jgi:hypothetical protein